MKRTGYIISIFCLILICSFNVQAQTVDQLKKERKLIEERIASTNKQIKQTQKNEKISINKLNVLKKNLTDRKKLITNYNSEINLLDKKIDQLAAERAELEKQLNKLKNNYAKLIQKTQANRSSFSKLMFIMSAQNFDQTVRRVRYLQEYTTFRKEQVRKIETVQQKIALKTDSLDGHKTLKVKAVKAKETEAAKLQQDEKNEKVMLAGLQEKEKKLMEEYRIQQRKTNEINTKIERIIAEEIRKAEARRKAEEAKRRAEEIRRKAEEDRRILAAKKAAAEKAAADKLAAERAEAERIAADRAAGKTSKTGTKKTTTTPVEPKQTAAVPEKTTPPVEVARVETRKEPEVIPMTREETLMSGNFERNRGRLPWPTDKGYITGHFGVQTHPELRHVTINNKGIYIQCPPRTNARAVYEGVVSARFSVPGAGNGIIVLHGNYRTVYANLTNIYVREGERVNAKQPIGQIYTDDDTGKTELFFSIYYEKSLLNPETWIAR